MLWRLFHRSKLDRLRHGDDAWAVVTGSTDGIGLATVEELLKRKFNVVVHGRNETKLTGVVERLRAQYPECKVDSVLADLSRPESAQTIISAIENKKVTLFINNAAATSSSFSLFDYFTDEQIDDVLRIGVQSITHLTRGVLPILLKNGPAALINIGSAAGSNSIPYVSLYAASKGYLLALTKSLAMEARITKSNLEVMYAEVHNVSSGSNHVKPNLATPTSPVMARALLGAIGCGKTVVTPYWVHEMSNYVMMLLPAGIADKVVSSSMEAAMAAGEPERSKQVTEARSKGRYNE